MASLIKLMEKPCERTPEFHTELFGLMVNIVEYFVNFFIDVVAIGVHKLTGDLALEICKDGTFLHQMVTSNSM